MVKLFGSSDDDEDVSVPVQNNDEEFNDDFVQEDEV